MTYPLFIVDAFTDKLFSGNPAAVVLLNQDVPTPWMQSVAQEMNLSETAFVSPNAPGPTGLRWFTPKTEVELCGHATLASAHVLWHIGQADKNAPISFSTLSGILECTRQTDRIAMSFPARPPEWFPKNEWPSRLLEALGLSTAEAVGQNGMDHIVRVASEDIVRGLAPHFAKLSEVDTRGIIVTAPLEGPSDFISRFFAPRSGVNEDPATGSAHCCLAPYWSEVLGRSQLLGYQASARGGHVSVEVRGDRVILEGHATLFMKGQLTELALPSSGG